MCGHSGRSGTRAHLIMSCTAGSRWRWSSSTAAQRVKGLWFKSTSYVVTGWGSGGCATHAARQSSTPTHARAPPRDAIITPLKLYALVRWLALEGDREKDLYNNNSGATLIS